MKLSIITINYNNAEGLRKTLASVAAQTYRNIEHIIVDGGSTDGSVDVIKEYVRNVERMNEFTNEGIHVVWLSEPDKGIYNAMNKGIEIALGKRVVNTFNRSELVEDKNKGIEIALGRRIVNTDHTTSSNSQNANRSTLNESLWDYVWILNSGDCVVAADTVERMMKVISDSKTIIPVLMGNILHSYSNGFEMREQKQYEVSKFSPIPIDASMYTFYRGTIPHDAAFVRKDLFEKYGLFDEKMKICADWKLYLNMIAFGDVVPLCVNIDVVLFDMTGISNANNQLRLAERRAYLEEILPASILKDYDRYGDDISLMRRLHRHQWAYRMTWFLERILFKLEKWNILHR